MEEPRPPSAISVSKLYSSSGPVSGSSGDIHSTAPEGHTGQLTFPPLQRTGCLWIMPRQRQRQRHAPLEAALSTPARTPPDRRARNPCWRAP